MSGDLVHSMFQDVLFPAADLATGSGADEFRLRRLKRYVPDPELDVFGANIVVFDLETTGLDPTVDRIIEVGAVRLVNFQPVAEFSSLVALDGAELTDDIVKITGITHAMLDGQPPIAQVLPKFLDFIDGSLLVAHNAEFDLSMLRASASRLGIELEWPCFCTLKMARELLSGLENRKLDTLAAHYGLTFEARHRAIGDIKVTIGVLAGLLRGEAKNLKSWSQLHPYAVS